MNVTQEDVEAGAASYTKGLLSVYDVFALGISSRLAWKCPKKRALAHYNQHVSNNHLDVGPGTGYFLDHCHFSSNKPRIALFDLNPNCLEVASRRIARYEPEVYRGNVLDAIEIDGPLFDSAGLSYVLHCLPGTIRTKSVVFEHLDALLNPGGIVFGSTALYSEVPKNWLSRRLMDAYNKEKILSNAEDDLTGLRWALSQHLSNVIIEIVGCVALFSAQKTMQ